MLGVQEKSLQSAKPVYITVSLRYSLVFEL